MTLEEIYYIGQTVAVLAILASLGAIWFQMRQSQKMERASAQRELLDRVAEYQRSFTLAEADHWLLGMDDLEAASYETKMVVHNKLSEFVFITESALNMHREGFFSEGTWAGIEGVMLGVLRTPGGQQFWAYARHYIGFEIADHLNKRLAEVGTDGPNFIDAVPFYRPRLEELKRSFAPASEPAEEEPAA